jgi:hypothetical protein
MERCIGPCTGTIGADDQGGPDGTHQHRSEQEQTMDTTVLAQAEQLSQTAERLSRVGLVFDRTCLSPAQRRVLFARQRSEVPPTLQPDITTRQIGFPYPTTR